MKKHLIIFFFLLSGLFIAQVPSRPEPAKLYNNLSKEFPNFLNSAEAAQLEEKLEMFSNETSNQIAVVIVDDLNGMDANQFAYQIGTQWGVGKADKDNGIVVLVKPTGNAGGRDLAIQVGYGLEGAIPDLATKKIREQEMQPYLKAGENYAALDRGTNVLMQLAKGEINVKDYTRQQHQGGGRQRSPLAAIIIVIFVVIILRSMFGGGGGGGGRTLSGAGRAIFWGSLLSGGFGGGRRGGGGFGGGGFGGGGGGWGGFGGGGFGGGGSSGKW